MFSNLIYAEATYFDGYCFSHIVAYEEYKRHQKIKANILEVVGYGKQTLG
jgi:hypothetical protein